MSRSTRVSTETGLSIGLLLFVVLLWWFWGTTLAPWMASNLAENYRQMAAAEANANPTAPTEVSGSDLSGAQRPASAASEPGRPGVGDFFTRLGQTGDLFGGVNALFASVALVGVFWAGALQRRAMLEARAAIGHQHFETAFFELLSLTREVLDRFEYEYVSGPVNDRSEKRRNGFRALNALTVRTFTKDRRFIPGTALPAQLQHLVNVYKRDVYRQYPSALGPFFRVLYQTFFLVSRAPIEDGEKVRYANIARGQLTEASVLLLALNGLTWRGRNFVPLIEQFGLLEHMHPDYLKRLMPMLRLAYRERAFAGSKERLSLALEAAPNPGPYAFDRDPDEPDFVVTQPPEDFEAGME